MSSKKALAQAVIAKAKAKSSTEILLHGQFTPACGWRCAAAAVLSQPSVFYWHVWGADLRSVPRVEIPPFYPLRQNLRW